MAAEDARVILQPKQSWLWRALIDASGPTILGWGGARGGGKSGGIRRLVVMLIAWFLGQTDVEHLVVWIVRRQFPDVRENHITPFFNEFPGLKKHYNDGKHALTMWKGKRSFTLRFVAADHTGRFIEKTKGQEAHFILVDQAEQFSQTELEHLGTCNRGPRVPRGFCKRVLMFNPGVGEGVGYLKRIFHDREYVDNEDPRAFAFLQSLGWDNAVWFHGIVGEQEFYGSDEWVNGTVACVSCSGHDPACADCRGSGRVLKRFAVFIKQTDYGKTLDELTPELRGGELWGDFTRFAGQYFAYAWEEKSVVIDPTLAAHFVMRRDRARKWLSTDWGFGHHAATGWWASMSIRPEEAADYFGITVSGPVPAVFLYRELAKSRMPEQDYADLTMAMTDISEIGNINHHYMGQDAWAQRGSANTIADQMDLRFRPQGFPGLEKATWERVDGWRWLHTALLNTKRFRNWDTNKSGPFDVSTLDVPLLFISSACSEVIRAIPSRQSARNEYTSNRRSADPLDVLKTDEKEDDVADMVRYGLASYLKPYIPTSVEEEIRKLAAQPRMTAEEHTRFNNRMRALEAQQANDMQLRRRIRGR
jgi:hypothetical protein